MGGSFQGVERNHSTVVIILADSGSSRSANDTGTSKTFDIPLVLIQMEQNYMWQMVAKTYSPDVVLNHYESDS